MGVCLHATYLMNSRLAPPACSFAGQHGGEAAAAEECVLTDRWFLSSEYRGALHVARVAPLVCWRLDAAAAAAAAAISFVNLSLSSPLNRRRWPPSPPCCAHISHSDCRQIYLADRRAVRRSTHDDKRRLYRRAHISPSDLPVSCNSPCRLFNTLLTVTHITRATVAHGPPTTTHHHLPVTPHAVARNAAHKHQLAQIHF